MFLTLGLMTTAVIVTLVMVAVLSDLTRTRLVLIIGAFAVAAGIAWLGGLNFLPALGVWLVAGYHSLEMLLLVVVLGVAGFMLRQRWANRNLGSLDLGSGLDQNEFERRCTGYLVSNGWTLTSRTTVSGMMIARAEKAGVRFALMFVGMHGDFAELAHVVHSDRLGGLGRLVFVCYFNPAVTHQTGAELDWRAIHYPELAGLERTSFEQTGR